MKIRVLPWFGIATLFFSLPAWAQDEGGGEPGDEVELAEDPLPPAGEDAEGETPDTPDTAFTRKPPPETTAAAAPAAEPEYPIEEVLRPITLLQSMSEVALDFPVVASPFATGGVLRGRFGVTHEAEAGLRYSIGSLAETRTSDSVEAIPGKALALDFVYRPLGWNWVGAQVSLPFYLDPFAFGLTLGAPMKFTFFKRLAVEFGRDFVDFKLHRFVPVMNNAAASDDLAQRAVDENQVVPDGAINILARVIWQHRPNLAFDARYGIRGEDFSFESDSPELLDVGLLYSTSKEVDIGGRIGFADLNDSPDSFAFALFAALRI